MKTLTVIAALGAVSVLVAGCGAGKEAEPPPPTAAVSTVTATLRDLHATVLGFGAVEFAPARAESLVVQVESQVAAVLVAAGSHVRQGDTLLRLRPSALTHLEVEKARREAELAAREARRLARLRDEGLATDAEAAAARTAADTALALRDSLVARTGDGEQLVLRAPRAGIVDVLTAQPGELLAAGTVVARIGDPAGLQARIGLESGDARRVALGAAASVWALEAGAAVVTARVGAVEGRVDKDSRLAAALVPLPAAAALMPGVPVRGRIVVASRAHAVAVPRAAVLYDGDEATVFVVVAGKAQRRVVHAGIDDEEFTEITDGIKAGESVVTTGNHELEDGMAVHSAEAPADAAPPAADHAAPAKDAS
jgi:membrane fusion protein (multidrug efflux system)